jgi:hypothetical protein
LTTKPTAKRLQNQLHYLKVIEGTTNQTNWIDYKLVNWLGMGDYGIGERGELGRWGWNGKEMEDGEMNGEEMMMRGWGWEMGDWGMGNGMRGEEGSG